MPHILKQLQYWAKKKPNKLALIDGSTQVTYDHLLRLVLVTRDHLEKNLDGKRDGFAIIMLSFSIDAWVAVLAARCLGLTTITADQTDSFVFGKVFPIQTIITNEAENNLSAINKAYGSQHQVIVIPQRLYEASELRRFGPGNAAIPEIIGGHVCYSSGSTGTPKLIEYNSIHEENATLSRIKNFRILSSSKVHNVGLSLSAASGWANHAAAIYSGSILINNSSDWVFDAFFRHEITHIFLNSRRINSLINFGKKYSFRKEDKLFLRVSGGFISYSRLEWIKNYITQNVWVGMGATEAGSVILTSKIENEGDAIWMYLCRGAEIEILDPEGKPVPDEQEGWLAVKINDNAPNKYLFDEDMSRERFKDGYFHTGDLAIRRTDGRIRLLGRLSETISYPGGKLPTSLVESEIRDALSYADAFVFSRQNDAAEDEIVVCLEGKHPVTETDLEWLRKKFGSISKIVVQTFDAFPHLHTGKIDRVTLRQKIMLR
jgi:acyl-coenzyme A synthetase/AMP-(fatty) acid ligase